jgi:hypothetical protein
MSTQSVLRNVDKDMLLAGMLGMVAAEQVTALYDDGKMMRGSGYYKAIYRTDGDPSHGSVRYLPLGIGRAPGGRCPPHSGLRLTVA